MNTIGLFVSDAPPPKDKLLKRAVDFLAKNKIKVFMPSLPSEVLSPKQKAETLHECIRNKEVDVVMAYWGGLKTIEMIKYIDWDLLKANPKPIVGYSDTTALLQALNEKCGANVMHGPALISFSKPLYREEMLEYLHKALAARSYDLPMQTSSNLQSDLSKKPVIDTTPLQVITQGQGRGHAIAGNLQTLLLLNGTEYELKLTGKVLFIEEAEEADINWFRRFLSQLILMKDFAKLQGLVISKFTEISNVPNKDVNDLLLEYGFDNCAFPVVTNFNSGHTDPIITIPYGREITINASKTKVALKVGIKK